MKYLNITISFIVLILFSVSAFADSPEQMVGKWAYIEKKDEFTDKPFYTVVTESKEDKALLLIQCGNSENNKILTISFKPNKFISGNSDFQYRVDKNPAITTNNITINDSMANFLIKPINKKDGTFINQFTRRYNDDAIELIKQMSNGSSVIMSVDGGKARFSLDGAAVQIKKVTDQCDSLFKK
jgi:hypothetical protein